MRWSAGLPLANIRRGVAQAGALGYWIGAPHVQQGYMTAAVRALMPVTFDVLRLHRLEAACIPTNLASIRLLEKTGFRREGYARVLSVHQRDLAGSPAVRAAAQRSEGLIAPRRSPPLGCHGRTALL